MNWPPDAFIYMKVGPHGGETLNEILIRKNLEFEKEDKIFWSYGGGSGPLHPKTQVQPFAQEWTQKQGCVYVLMERLNNPSPRFGAPAGTATHCSVNGDEWEGIPEGIPTAPPHALVLGEITPVDRELDLRDFAVGVGPSKGRNATDYIKYQVDKGCFVAARPMSGHLSKPISIGYLARLLDPYGVFLLNQC